MNEKEELIKRMQGDINFQLSLIKNWEADIEESLKEHAEREQSLMKHISDTKEKIKNLEHLRKWLENLKPNE